MHKGEVSARILEALHFRHATKVFDKDKKIAQTDFDFILEAARLAPSSFGFEPWKFVVVQDELLREQLLPYAWGAKNQLPTASHFVIILARTMRDLRFDTDYVMRMMKDIHHLPREALEARHSFYKQFQESDFKLLEDSRYMFDWACKQTYIALSNMMNTAAQMGIDSCPIEGFDKEQVEKILSQRKVMSPNHFGVAVMVAFGYRVKEPRPKTRLPLTEIVEWVE
ncbi:NAD(P)H-dependent oxidoreductase [Hazenella sp. IB182357]|uniref:NAD(P)H-dependent oxidoreductase n=1 Tax=Polycladospora coralii TaxID=2771432 RepID=A0A926NBF1_9BACL|nr:NAD(P)H-dependent oxidoreductase [Polycladospora coralii]MBD1372655.1 NAD(P)H-dependent oxidoreductase [Polycladospora coralii]MBS7531049.1 NAD(P)H-dependent oxidoreductase [Polycladospora coralii]